METPESQSCQKPWRQFFWEEQMVPVACPDLTETKPDHPSGKGWGLGGVMSPTKEAPFKAPRTIEKR